jgi:uncharacterized cupredoxin-like copper-binding protein
MGPRRDDGTRRDGLDARLDARHRTGRADRPRRRPGREGGPDRGQGLLFSPNQVHLTAGATANLVLANQGDVLHDLTDPALGLHLQATAGATATGALTVPRPGTYEFFCSVPGHREAGMSGILVVT